MPSTQIDFHLEQFLPYLVHRVGSNLAEGFDEGFAEAGVSLQEWRALSILYEYGAQTMGEIARRTSINSSSMTRLIGQMEKHDLVKRERQVANQRTVYVRLLPEGRKKVEFLIPRVLEYQHELSRCFSAEELKSFKTLLVKFFHSLTGDRRSGHSIETTTESRERRLAG